MTWLTTAGGDHEVTVRSGQVVCRNAKGRELSALPARVRKDPVTVTAQRLADWLVQHERRCHAEVERWMISSQPISTAMLAGVWPDDIWRAALTDLVVLPVGGDPGTAGFLLGATTDGIAVATEDLLPVRVGAGAVTIPHPLFLPHLDRLREVAAERAAPPACDQLFRRVWHRPDAITPGCRRVADFAGAAYRDWADLTGHAAASGYRVTRTSAICTVDEGGETYQACVGLRDGYPLAGATTGDLTFVRDGTVLDLSAVGPVLWSEGMRMAAALHAGPAADRLSGPAADRP